MVMAFFPPWRGQTNLNQEPYDLDAGYAFLLTPPEEGRLYNGTLTRLRSYPYINLPLLTTEWVTVTAVAAFVGSFMRGRQRDDRQ